jgi:3-phenylpropionate/trans-cinnamate dioxygenase ferredoxin subunit
MSTHRVLLCRLDELGDGKARCFNVGGLAVAVVRIGADVFAIGDRCTHQNVSLSEGEVDEDELLLECWKHGSQFSLVTGEPLQLPALKPTPVYPAEVHAGEVWLTLP